MVPAGSLELYRCIFNGQSYCAPSHWLSESILDELQMRLPVLYISIPFSFEYQKMKQHMK